VALLWHTPAAAEDAPAPVEGAKHVDAALQRRIDDAIEGATRWLRDSVRDDGSFPPSALTRASTYDIGLAALAGYAMRHGGVARDDPRMVRVRDFVRRSVEEHVPAGKDAQPDLDVYSAGLSIAFLLEAGVATDDPALVRTVRWLEDSWTEAGWWSYGLLHPARPAPKRPGAAAPPPLRGGYGNISTTLYAVFGLHAAARHGIAVDRSGLDRYMDSLGVRQMRDGGFVYAEPLPSQQPSAKSYFGAASNAIAAYLLAGEATGRLKGPADAMDSPVVKDALPYLEADFGPGVWDKPAAPPIQRSPGAAIEYRGSDGVTPLCAEDTYNLYASERIGMLLATDAIGKVRWYERGARWLVETQRDDGHWSPEDVPEYPAAATTAFGLLFLARSVRPIGGPATPRDAGAVTGTAPDAFSFDGAAGFERLEWYDLLHRALARLEGLEGDARKAFAPRFALLGPRVVRALIFELESESRDRRRAARDVLVAVTGDDVGFDPDGDAKARATGIAAWRKWLDNFEPFLVLENGALVTKPK
jgi:hypothetical protein